MSAIKKQSPYLIVCVLFLTTQACVTVSEGSEMSSASASYAVQCDPRADLRSDEFKVVRCTFISKSATNVTIHGTKVSFAPSELDDQIARPDAIASYRDQLAKSGAGKDSQQLSVVGSMIVATAIVVGASRSGSGPGSAVVMSGLTGTALAKQNRVDYSSDHLLGPGFSLRPRERQTKLLLVKTSKDTMRPEGMTLCVDSPSAECFEFSFGPSSRARVGSW